MKMKQTDCSETSAYKIQTPGNYMEESIQQGIKYEQGGENSFLKFCYLLVT
jgi:hypothetical protein